MVEVEGMDGKSTITMFIEALGARDLYKSSRREGPGKQCGHDG